MYEVFDHTADLGLRIKAASLELLFADAAEALFSLIVGSTSAIEPRETVHLQVSGAELDYLLFDWLNELLFTFESRHLLLKDFQVKIADGQLVAQATGEPFDRQRHPMEHEVKAITYHGLLVEQRPDGWFAEVILDI